MAEKELRVRPNGELRAVTDDDGRRAIEGYAIRFNEPSEDLGGFTEYIAPGSVKLDSDLRAFFDHQSQYVLGRSTVGTLETHTDDSGVWMKAYPPDTQWARDLMTSIERGDISGMSFGFYLNDDVWEKRDGKAVRTVTDADVFELSVVALPAYPTTSAYARDKASALLEEPEVRDSEDDAPGAESEPIEVPGTDEKPSTPHYPAPII
jgi:HK97 family phage prohead protease